MENKLRPTFSRLKVKLFKFKKFIKKKKRREKQGSNAIIEAQNNPGAE